MSTIVDNITLGLLSLKEALSNYLNDNKWENQYSIFLSGDPKLMEKEIVLGKADRYQIGLPIIVIDTGRTSNIVNEIGSAAGNDIVVLSIAIVTMDDNQLRTLGNVVRRKLDGLAFTVYDYSSSKHTSLGIANLGEAALLDLTNMNTTNPAEKFVVVINCNMEINSSDFL